MELRAAYLGTFKSAKDKEGYLYQDDRSRLVGATGYILIYAGSRGESLRFVPEEAVDEMLSVPCGKRTGPLWAETMVFESANSVYEFEEITRIR